MHDSRRYIHPKKSYLLPEKPTLPVDFASFHTSVIEATLDEKEKRYALLHAKFSKDGTYFDAMADLSAQIQHYRDELLRRDSVLRFLCSKYGLDLPN